MKTQADYMRELDEIKAFNGWNDRELGALLGTSGALVSNWRTGKTQMTNKSKKEDTGFFCGNGNTRETAIVRIAVPPGRYRL